MRLILVRHGRTRSNVGFLLDTGVPGADLDDTGREQAHGLVERLAEHPIEAIYASTLVRTQQTAAPLAAVRNLPVEVLPGLREISAGDDELASDATRYIGTLMRWQSGDLAARIPGGENAMEFFERFDEALATVAANAHEAAMLVSHGAALRVWSSARVDGFSAALGAGHLANTGVIVIDGSVDAGWRLASLDGVLTFEGFSFDPEAFED
ncbi:MAG: histidine phosphatase family protein [Propionicimonas sp.]